MFEKGCYVTYRSEGVCIVLDICNQRFVGSDQEESYYILAPINDMKSTVFVPMNNETLVGYMRALLSADELNTVLSEVRDERIEWIPENRARNAAFKQILSTGSRRDMIALLNTLYDRLDYMKSIEKKVGTMDITLLSKAERLFFEELSFTCEIKSQGDVRAVLRGEITLEPLKE